MREFEDHFDMSGVAALLVTPDSKYLMQLRDDLKNVMMRNHWGLFGGWRKENESADHAMKRELAEELNFIPSEISWFTETAYLVPGSSLPPLHKTFFEVKISYSDIEGMCQREGAGKSLYTATEIRAIENLIPWDGLAVVCHDQQHEISRSMKIENETQ
jgi:8-oxo-dGTP pyrophosphatase MutT (NUDIX family)